jgi:hypothetical protein
MEYLVRKLYIIVYLLCQLITNHGFITYRVVVTSGVCTILLCFQKQLLVYSTHHVKATLYSIQSIQG